MSTFSRLSRFIAVATLLAVGAVATIAYANHSWGGYHWARTANPFTLKLIDSVTPGWNSYLGTTSADWSVASTTLLGTTIVSGDDSNTIRKRCPAVLGKDRICNAAYGNNGWLGLAQVWVYSDGHIAQGTVKVNDTYFNNTAYYTPAWRNLVMCQEVGHTLGLDHQDTTFDNANLGTCMDYTNDPDGTIKGQLDNQHPNAHDYEELGLIYAHHDSWTTVGQTGPGKHGNTNTVSQSTDGGKDIDLNNPSAWGKAVRQDSRGNNSLYERDLGNGQKVFTFVIWAD